MEYTERNRKISESRANTMARRQNQQICVYKAKIQSNKLTPKQKEQLKMIFVEGKWFVNDILNFSQENNINEYKIGKTCKISTKEGFIEKEFKYIPVSCKQTLYQQLLDNIKGLSVLKNHGHKVGKLKFKKRIKEINFKQIGVTHKILGNSHIKLQGIKNKIKVNGLKQIESLEIANVKLLDTASGYYIAITCFKDKIQEEKENTNEKKIVGIDFGCQTSFTLSNGEKIDVKIEEPVRLRKLQRKAARLLKINGKNTNNRTKILTKIHKYYDHIANKKKDIANKFCSKILNEYDEIYIQDENLRGWHKSGHGKAVQYSCMGLVKSKLKNNNKVHLLSQWIPTTKYFKCNICNNERMLSKDESHVKNRIIKCSNCGNEFDRDIHSAENMILLGQELVKFMPPDSKSSVIKIPKEYFNNKFEKMKEEDSTLSSWN